MIYNQSELLNKLAFLIVLFFSLNTYYFYDIGFPIVQLIGFGILLLFFEKVSKSNLKLLIPYFLYISFFYIIFSFYLLNITTPIPLIGFLLCIFVFLYFSSINITRLKYFIKAIELLTIILIFFWLLQFFTYYIFGVTLDYFIDIVGYKQRTNFGFLDQYFMRPSSLFLEPAMYVNAMFLIFVFRLFLYGKIDIKNLLILFSILMTMSLYGYFVFIIFILIIFVGKPTFKNMIIFFVLATIIGLVFIYWNDNAIIQRILNPLANQSGEDRLVGNINSFFKESLLTQLFGFGIGNAEYNGYSGSGLHFLFYNTGLIGIIILYGILFVISLKKTNRPIIFIMIFTLSILNNSSSITSFFNWMMLGLIINVMNYNRFYNYKNYNWRKTK